MCKIIAMAGRKQSGKTTSCEYIGQEFEKKYWEKHGYVIDQSEDRVPFKIYNFADPLKKLCIDILGLTDQQCYGTDANKNEIVNCKWPGIDAKMTAREVLQYVGTDIFRRMQHNVWADATIRKIKKENFPLALVADCRFPNEVKAVKSAGGIVIKLNRNLYHSEHESEIALDVDKYDQSNFDFTIDNQDLQIVDTHQLIKNYLEKQRILSL